MRPVTRVQASAGASKPVAIDFKQNTFQVAVICDLSDDADLTYQIEFTGDDIYAKDVDGQPLWNPATGNWQIHPTLNNKSASDSGNFAFPPIAVRINVTSYTAGSVRMKIIMTKA